MSDMPNNGKSYTEVVAEVNASISDMRVEFIDRINDSDTSVLEKLDTINSGLVRGEERYNAIYDKMDGKGGMNERIKTNAITGKSNADKIKVVGGIEAALLMLGAWLGLSK